MNSGAAGVVAGVLAVPWLAASSACSPGDLLVGRTRDAGALDADAAPADALGDALGDSPADAQGEASRDASDAAPGDAPFDTGGDAVTDAAGMTCDLGSTGPCPRGQYCRFENGSSCIPDGGSGHCVERPTGCDGGSSAAPDGGVCGCNLVIYANECAARTNGADVLGPAGLCPSSPPLAACNSRLGLDCDAGAFCDFVDIGCGSGIQGRCLPRDNPIVCSSMCSPICGCDNSVYCNACLANRDGGVDRTASSTGTCP